MLSLRTRFIILGIIITAMLATFIIHNNKERDYIVPDGTLSTTLESWDVALADESSEREKGLSRISSLPLDQGMFFKFDQPGMYPFWMKEMNFPLDIIWFKKTDTKDVYRIVFIAENVAPNTYPTPINPNIDADAVVEINAGQVQQFGLVKGSDFLYRKFDSHYIYSGNRRRVIKW